MKTFFIFTLLFSLNTYACWKLEGTFSVDGETWKIDQKFDHDKEYSFPMGPFILNLAINKGKSKTHPIKYLVQEKKGIKLTIVTKGEDELEEERSNEIFAKGLEDQPNSILTLKLKKI